MKTKARTCSVCGGAMGPDERGEVHNYAGLPVTVEAEIARCTKCGEEEVTYTRMESLHKAIASAIVLKPGRLAPAEVRFLRGELLLEGQELAQVMGTTPETVSRWETGAASMGKVADRLLRALVLLQAGDFPVMRFRDLARAAAHPPRLRFQMDGGHWRQGTPRLAAVS